MISALVEVGKRWLDSGYALRQEAIRDAASEFCLSSANFTLALDWMFSFWNEKFIASLQAPGTNKPIANAVQILAGNTPAVIAQAFLQGAVLNVPQYIKIPSLQTVFPRLLHQSLADVSKELAALFEVNTWQNNYSDLYAKLAKTDLIIAYGHDKTIDLLKSHSSSSSIFIAEGHAVSCAVIFKEAANRESLDKLAWDMLSYDQRGCLSPRVTFIQEGGELSPEDCAAIFAKEILPSRVIQLSRGGLFPGESAAILQRRAVYGFRGVIYTGDDWTVCFDKELVWPTEALPRFMPFKSFASLDDLMHVLQPVKKNLISIGLAGENCFFDYPNLRHVCELGLMQKQFLPLRFPLEK